MACFRITQNRNGAKDVGAEAVKLRAEMLVCWFAKLRRVCCWAAVPVFCAATLGAAHAEKPRLLVLTDIGGDPDDMQSMRRLMLYANEFEIAGLIASASGTPRETGRETTRPELIRAIIGDYGAVRERLARHASGYPTDEALLRVVRAGSAKRDVSHIGKAYSTAGSRLIISAADAAASPLWVVIWGGAHDLAQALYDVRAERSPEALAAFVAKLRVYAIADQDAWRGRPGTGEWTRAQFPELRYVEAGPPGMNSATSLFRGMYQNDSIGGGAPVVQLVRDPLIQLNQRAWVEANVRTGHGPLGADYPLVKQNPGSENNTVGVKEGDTPSWFFVLPNGLSDPEHPEYGGWGGRFRHESGGHYVDAEDEHWSGSADSAVRRKWTVARWREAYQNDFAARMDWCRAESYSAANHNPVVVLNGDRSKDVRQLRVSSGASVSLSAAGTSDPDGDALAYNWFVYHEAGSCEERVELSGNGGRETSFVAPAVVSPCELHVICEVTDDGLPRLYGYRRAVVTVQPK